MVCCLWTVCWLFIVACLAGIVRKIVRTRNKKVKKLRGLFTEAGHWFLWKKFLFCVVLWLRNCRRCYHQQKQSIYSVEDEAADEEKERPQKLTDNPHAIDSLYFYGGSHDNDTAIIVRFARRPDRAGEMWTLLRLPDGRHLVHAESPDTRRVGIDPRGWQGGGWRIGCDDPMERWKLAFNGWLRTAESTADAPELVHVHFKAKFRAFTNACDVPREHSIQLIADAIAREPWTRQLFDKLKSHENQTHYEQWGSYTGTLSVDRAPPTPIDLKGYRDHSFGIRDWKTYECYLAHFGQLENGACFSLGTVCMPATTSHIRYGYYVTPYGKKCPITWHNINLWEIVICDPIPACYKFRFYADGKKFDVQLLAGLTTTFHAGPQLEATIKERFVQFRVNGLLGVGVAELCARNYAHNNPVTMDPLAVPSAQEVVLEDDQTSTLLCVPFTDPACSNSALVGGKGAQLGQLTTLKDKVNVPPGFVVTTSAYNRFLRQSKSLTQEVRNLSEISRGQKICDVQAACDVVSNVLLEQTPPENLVRDLLDTAAAVLGPNWRDKRVAVRSSAAGEDGTEASGAGQMSTYLGVVGEENLFRHIQLCWASQFTYQAVEYRRQHGMPIDCKMAVVVMEMVAADVAGVLFTNDPITGDTSRMALNANYGLGESVVSGDCEPDSYHLGRYPGGKLSVEKTTAGSKQQRIVQSETSGIEKHELDADESLCLNEAQLLALGKLGLLIESFYGSPRDIEWAIEKDQIFILQARAITTTEIESETELLHEFDSAISFNKELLTTANIGEMMPLAQTPLSLSVFGSAINRCIQASNVTAGTLDSTVKPRRFLPSVCNHQFINLYCVGLLSELHSSIGNMDMAYLVLLGRILKQPTIYDIEYFVGRSGLLQRLKTFVLYTITLLRSRGKSTKWETRLRDGYHIPHCHTAAEQFKEIDGRLADYYECWNDTIHNSSQSGVWSMILMTILTGRTGWKNEVFSQLALLLATCKNVYSADVPTALEDLAIALSQDHRKDEFLAMPAKDAAEWLLTTDSGEAGEAFRRFLKRHGHRCVREAEFRETSWNAEPGKVVGVLQAMITAGLIGNHSKTELTVDEAVDRISLPLSTMQKWIIRMILPKAREGVALREWGKSLSIEMVDVFKEAFRRLGNQMQKEGRLPDSDLIYFLTYAELRSLLVRNSDGPRLIAGAQRRRRILDQQMAVKFPELSVGLPVPSSPTDNELTSRRASGPSESRITGLPVSHGIVRGVARVVKTLGEAKNIQKGEIAIVPYTDVGWTPYFPLLSGLVTEKGGLLSHGAVVAREYGLPCVVGCGNATEVFQSGDVIILNAVEGFIEK